MSVESWIYQAVAERADEIRVECGYDEDLQDMIEDTLKSLDGETKETVGALINRMECERLEDYVKIYRSAFRDGLRYAFEVVGKFPIESIED